MMPAIFSKGFTIVGFALSGTLNAQGLTWPLASSGAQNLLTSDYDKVSGVPVTCNSESYMNLPENGMSCLGDGHLLFFKNYCLHERTVNLFLKEAESLLWDFYVRYPDEVGRNNPEIKKRIDEMKKTSTSPGQKIGSVDSRGVQVLSQFESRRYFNSKVMQRMESLVQMFEEYPNTMKYNSFKETKPLVNFDYLKSQFGAEKSSLFLSSEDEKEQNTTIEQQANTIAQKAKEIAKLLRGNSEALISGATFKDVEGPAKKFAALYDQILELKKDAIQKRKSFFEKIPVWSDPKAYQACIPTQDRIEGLKAFSEKTV